MPDKPQKPATHLAVPMPLAQQLASYLAQHPYNQVAQLLAALSDPKQCPPINIEASDQPIDIPGLEPVEPEAGPNGAHP